MKWLLMIPGLLWAQSFENIFDFDRDRGSASFQMLKLEFDARVISLAGGGSALPGNTGSATEVNPASASLDSVKLVASHGYPFKETGSQVSALTWNLPFWNLTSHKFIFHYRYLGFDNIKGYSEEDEPLIGYSAHTYKIQSGMAGVYQKIVWGMLFSFVENNVSYAKYYTAVVDAGIQYHALTGLWVGASFNNGGIWTSKSINPNNPQPFAPSVARAGVAYYAPLIQSIQVIATADAKTRNDEKLHLPVGLELVYREVLSVRAGYPILLEEGYYTFGTGVNIGLFKLDYALKLHESLSPGHFWSLGLKF